jgi:hypothetical protein
MQNVNAARRMRWVGKPGEAWRLRRGSEEAREPGSPGSTQLGEAERLGRLTERRSVVRGRLSCSDALIHSLTGLGAGEGERGEQQEGGEEEEKEERSEPECSGASWF